MSHWRRECRVIVSGICGMICLVAGIAALGADHTFDGVYSGKRVLTKGSEQICPAQDDVSVTIHGEMLTFTNSALKKFAITFYPSQDGSFGETYTDEGGTAVRIHGRVIREVIEADVTNPPCEYHWNLKKE